MPHQERETIREAMRSFESGTFLSGSDGILMEMAVKILTSSASSLFLNIAEIKKNY